MNDSKAWEKFVYQDDCIDPSITAIHHLFEKQSVINPNKRAIIFDNQFITYKNLNEEANQVTNLLLRAGLKQGMIVGIYVERSIKTIISMLAISKAGGGFLLIDKNLPPERARFIINDSKMNFILSEDEDSFLIRDIPGVKIININASSFYSKDDPKISVIGNDIAYAIYTSGTSGNPKGVAIEHKGLVNTLLNQIEILKINGDDKILCVAPLSFDAFIWEIGGALLAGAEIYLTTAKQREKIRSIGHLIKQYRITIVTLTPSILRLIPDKFLNKLRVLVSAGEACTADLTKKVNSKCCFYNAYGPTEISICATMSSCKINDKSISIGLPLKNVTTYVLKDNLEEASVGEIGTLYVGGLGLARGYLNNQELTNKFFITNPFQDNSSDRLYNTGDLVCVNSDGSFRYVGRKDKEIKIRGNRVNLNEIQCLLTQHPNIHNSLVVIHKNYNHCRNKIIAAIETDNEAIDFKDIKDYLQQYLPSYMLPHKLIVTKQLLLSANGKLGFSLF